MASRKSPKTPEEKRSFIMSRIKSKDTGIELSIRKALWRKGYRYRVHYSLLPGKPDIVFIKEKVAVFCDSEFWHGKRWGEKKESIRKNREYWIKKIEGNIERDKRVNEQLSRQGWLVIRFWGEDIIKDTASCVRQIEEEIAKRRGEGRTNMEASVALWAMINCVEENELVDEANDNGNRINLMGQALERFVEKAFCKGLRDPVVEFKGGKNWPPDLLIRNGAAIEVKKVETISEIQLNSSFPSRYLTPESRISNECKEILRQSKNRDIVYVIGHVEMASKEDTTLSYLRNLSFVYGSTYVASFDTYADVASEVQDAIRKLPHEDTNTRELGRVNFVDTLGRASLRIRGMWILKHPLKEIHVSRVIAGLAERIPSLVGIIPWRRFLEEESFIKNKGIRVDLINEEFNIEIGVSSGEWNWKLGKFGNSAQIPATLHSNIHAYHNEFACYKTILPDPDNPAKDIQVAIVLSDF